MDVLVICLAVPPAIAASVFLMKEFPWVYKQFNRFCRILRMEIERIYFLGKKVIASFLKIKK